MKLPKKFQGCFDWTVAPLAINAGHKLEIFSNGLWRKKICHEAVRSDERYRVMPPREFSDGWYRMIGSDNLPISQIVYHERGLWYRVEVIGGVDINPNDVGDRIL